MDAYVKWVQYKNLGTCLVGSDEHTRALGIAAREAQIVHRNPEMGTVMVVVKLAGGTPSLPRTLNEAQILEVTE